MRTIDDIPMSKWPSPLPLHLTPPWQQFLLLLPAWRFWSDGWVYFTAAQYERIFVRKVP